MLSRTRWRLDLLPADILQYLKELRAKYSVDQVLSSLDRCQGLRVLVIGDAIVDEYNYCRVAGTISKYPAISAVYEDSVVMAGGSLAVARHIGDLVSETHLTCVVGDDSYSELINNSLSVSRVTSCLFTHETMRTVVKQRFIGRGYPNPLNLDRSGNHSQGIRLFEVGYFPQRALPTELEDKLVRHLEAQLHQFDVVVVADFGHGLLSERLAGTIIEKAGWWAVNAQTNSTNFGFNLVTKYSKPNYVCVDELEARLPFGDRYSSLDSIAQLLQQKTACPIVMITQGRDGLAYYTEEGGYSAPPLATDIIDTVGSGDAVLAISALCVHLRLPPDLTAFLSACAGAIATGTLGNEEPVTKESLRQFVTCALG